MAKKTAPDSHQEPELPDATVDQQASVVQELAGSFAQALEDQGYKIGKKEERKIQWYIEEKLEREGNGYADRVRQAEPDKLFAAAFKAIDQGTKSGPGYKNLAKDRGVQDGVARGKIGRSRIDYKNFDRSGPG